ncbi:cupin domain-containing protein [Candidatus Dojkabacteria bacterium]|nr:cupin domain-containing protein [Candidatus Dojkabacteria bacterium]
MKVIKKNEANDFENSSTCWGKEYQHGDNDMGIALIEIKGRYPEKGNCMNTKCKELVYVTKGKVKIVKGDEFHELETGDSVFIYPNEKYYWEGDCEMAIICSPVFDHRQHKILE